jgi:hypothetical protein
MSAHWRSGEDVDSRGEIGGGRRVGDFIEGREG